MLHIAAQANGKGFARHAPTAPFVGDAAGNPQIHAPIGHAGQLRQDAPGLGEGLVHIPQRARATGLGKVKVRGRLALADVARAIDADKEKRHPRRVRALQGREAVAHHLVAHAKALAQQLNVVAQAFGRLQKPPIGQDQRPGHVVGQANAGQAARGLVLPVVGGQQGLHLRLQLQQRQLRGQLKGLLAGL